MRKVIMLVIAVALVVLPGAGAAQADPGRPDGVAAVRAFERRMADVSAAQSGVTRIAGAARMKRVPGPVPTGGTAASVRPGTAGDSDVGARASGFGQVAVGARHTCAVLVLRNVWCWGANDQGQLGVGSTLSARHPVRASARGGLADVFAVVQLVAGAAHTCALAVTDLDGGADVYCWGANDEGQLGDGGFADRTSPEQVATGAVAIAAGAEHTCALMSDGTVSCWGRNDVGQLGTGTAGGSQSTAQEVPGLAHITDIAAGDDDTCAIDNDGRAWCWGSDTQGQLGDGGGASGTPSPSPVEVTGAPAGGFTSIDLGARHACALAAAGAAYCWGDNTAGQLGSLSVDTSQPALVRGPTKFVSVSAGGDSTCAISTSLRPYCWGANDDGQLGTGGHTARDVPTALDDSRVRVSPLFRALLGTDRPLVSDLEVGSAHGCLLSADTEIYCTGRDRSRQLGNGTATAADVPGPTELAPGPALTVRATSGDGELRVTWSAPADPGAGPVQAYAAIAFTGNFETGGDCSVAKARHCVIPELSNNKRYTVVVATLTQAGISYSALAYGTPVGGGSGAGLPVTGPGLTAAWLLLGAGAALLLVTRRPRL